MNDDLKWEFKLAFTPVEALRLIDEHGLEDTVRAYQTTERQLRQMFADWLAGHRGDENRELRTRKRQEIANAYAEIGRRVFLLHSVHDAVYGEART